MHSASSVSLNGGRCFELHHMRGDNFLWALADKTPLWDETDKIPPPHAAV